MVQSLADSYSNATAERKLEILDDLEFYLHQYDNARDFVTIGGMDKIVRRALVAEEEREEGVTQVKLSGSYAFCTVFTLSKLFQDLATELRGTAALIFCACVQSHTVVKVINIVINIVHC